MSTEKMSTEDMSFEDLLKEYSSYEPDIKQAEKDREKISSSERMTNYIKLEDNKKVVLRFLPPKVPKDASGKKNPSYVSTKRHYVQIGEERVSILCTGDDICCRAINYLRALGGEQNNKTAKNLKAGERYYFAAYNRNDGRTGIFAASSKVAGTIIDGLLQDNIFDIIKGHDFSITKRTGKTSFPEFDTIIQIKSTPLETMKQGDKIVLNKEKMETILKTIPDLTFLTQPDSEELKEKFEKGLGALVNLEKMYAWEHRNSSYKDEVDAASEFGDDDVVMPTSEELDEVDAEDFNFG